jgi:hypothetical protein
MDRVQIVFAFPSLGKTTVSNISDRYADVDTGLLRMGLGVAKGSEEEKVATLSAIESALDAQKIVLSNEPFLLTELTKYRLSMVLPSYDKDAAYSRSLGRGDEQANADLIRDNFDQWTADWNELAIKNNVPVLRATYLADVLLGVDDKTIVKKILKVNDFDDQIADMYNHLVRSRVQTRILLIREEEAEELRVRLLAQGITYLDLDILEKRSLNLGLRGDDVHHDVVWRTQSMVYMNKFTVLIATRQYDWLFFVPVPIISTFCMNCEIRIDRDMIEDYATQSVPITYSGSTSSGIDSVAMGNALRDACVKLSRHLGLMPIMLGSEIESVHRYPELRHYGNYKLDTPMSTDKEAHSRSRPFSLPIRTIAEYAGRKIYEIRFRDKPRVQLSNVTILYSHSRSLYYTDGDESYRTSIGQFRRMVSHLTLGYAQKWLFSTMIRDEDIHDLTFSENEVAVSLFASSNTLNERDAWKRLTKGNHIIALPYRREFDGAIWEDKYSDYTYTVEELPTFFPVDKFVQYVISLPRVPDSRTDLSPGADYQSEPFTRWVVITNLIEQPRYQTPPFNMTEFAKVLTVNLRERLQHTNDTLHSLRRIVRFNKGLPDTMEIAGHMINILLASHYRPVSVKTYFKMVETNLRGDYANVAVFEPNSKNTKWHSREEWLSAFEVYELMATAFGWRPKSFDLAWL